MDDEHTAGREYEVVVVVVVCSLNSCWRVKSAVKFKHGPKHDDFASDSFISASRDGKNK